MLGLAMPFLVAFCHESPTPNNNLSRSAIIVEAMWRNTFTLCVTAIMTGLFWLVLLLWSKLFSLIGFSLFERLFFRNDFFPSMATGAAIAAGIVFCRRLPGAVGVYRNVITLAVGVIVPLQAISLLLFLVCLPFTGLAIIPKSFSAATLLLTMTLPMLIFSAMAGIKEQNEPRWQRVSAQLVLAALWLTPLLAGLAVWGLWLRVADYGWTVDRVYGAVIAFIAFAGSLLMVWFQRPVRSQDANSMNTYIALMLALASGGWFLLHSPVIDPWRIMVTSQHARYEQGKAKADAGDLYVLSTAGRRGNKLLQTLNDHPQWLEDPVRVKVMLMQILAGHNTTDIQPDISTLRQAIPVRPGSETPPKSWCQAQKGSEQALRTCLADVGSCLVWMQDLNNDGSSEVLLYSPHSSLIFIYTLRGNTWQQIGSANVPQSADSAMRKAMPDTVPKAWRDLEINGQRLSVDYYGYEGQ
ncbi:DUF4153 domain-containing protein [Pantoea ananatis]|uniref:DUF4153 domain-containing protein n=2 Tax=Pantoea ananas TaxID=553 RepID=UPI002025D5D2|nr:DUF4153 domain-containing protein [Pantoea ananatis]URL16346.1 DUF4153 domain-containing protein [Pantoea ananatis]